MSEQSDKKIENVIKELKELIKGDNKEAISAKTQELSELSGKMAEKAYAGGGEGGTSGAGGSQGSADSAKKDDAVVDAEFEEVKDKE